MIEEKAVREVIEHMADNIIVDDIPISYYIEEMDKDSMKALKVDAKDKVDAYKEDLNSGKHDFTTSTISADLPSMDEIRDIVVRDIAPRIEDVGAAMADFIEDYEDFTRAADELNWNMTHEARWQLEDAMQNLVNATGSFIKSEIVPNVDYSETMLATKHQPACANNNVTVGVCSGLVGAFVGFAAFAIVNRKKKMIAAEQPLL